MALPPVRLLLVIFLNLLNSLWQKIIYLLWKINGTAAHIDASISGEETKNTAQVLKIVFRNPFTIMDIGSPTAYFTVHERFAPADIVLNKRMHLLMVTSKMATFTEVDCDILDVRKHPFMWNGQTNRAVRLIRLPIKVFYDLVDKIDVMDRKVVWMFHTTRCGSTAWSQAFHSLPGWTVLSEPQTMFCSIMFGDHGQCSVESYSKTAEFRRLALALIKINLHNAPKGGSVFWKEMFFGAYYIETILECFPHHKMVFAYRDALPTITSLEKTFNTNSLTQYVSTVMLRHDPADDDWWFRPRRIANFTNGYDHNFCKKVITKVRPKTYVEWACFLFSTRTVVVRNAMEKGVKIKPIKYENMLQDGRNTVAKVFDYLEIPADLVDQACEALGHDSQAGVKNISRETRKKVDKWTEDADAVAGCNMILNEFGLPDLNSSFLLPDSF